MKKSLPKKPKVFLKSKEEKINPKKIKSKPEQKIKKKKHTNIIIKGTNDVILISIDRNWLAKRSHELNAVITSNFVKDPKMLDGDLLSDTLKCHGANEIILEILQKYDV